MSAARVQLLEEQWRTATGRFPNAAELQPVVQQELDNDMLFQEGLSLQLHHYDPVIQQRLLLNMRFLGLAENQTEVEQFKEALRLNLHLGDDVIRGRLIQLMQEILLDKVSVPAVSEGDLALAFESSKADHREPRKYSIKHLYFSSEQLAQAISLKTRIAQEDLAFESAKQFSEPFLQGYQFFEQGPAQLAKYLGTEFVNNFEHLAPSVGCLLYTSPSPRDATLSRMPSSA